MQRITNGLTKDDDALLILFIERTMHRDIPAEHFIPGKDALQETTIATLQARLIALDFHIIEHHGSTRWSTLGRCIFTTRRPTTVYQWQRRNLNQH